MTIAEPPLSPTRAPRIALIGRMNVGKSSIFNRLTETQHAIVSSWPGTTRDVREGTVLWRGKEWTLLDSGGMDADTPTDVNERVIETARRLVANCDLILFVIDGKTGLMPQDHKLITKLRTTNKRLFLVVNKMDNDRDVANVDDEIYRTGMRDVLFCSARNGRGSGELLDAIDTFFTDRGHYASLTPTEMRIAIVGRPNVGKSTLLNSILQEERVIVANEPHTTRDSTDVRYDYKGTHFRLVDTAGIRKRPRIGNRWPDARLGTIERESVRQSLQAIEHADIVILMIEAGRRVTSQDKQLAHTIAKNEKPLIIAINKWDAIEEKTPQTIERFRDYFDRALPFLRYAPMIFISALEGTRVHTLLDMVIHVAQNQHRSLSEEQLAPILAKLNTIIRPRATNVRKDKKPKIIFRTFVQEEGIPPTFLLRVNLPKDVPPALLPICERELREHFDFDGTQIKIMLQK